MERLDEILAKWRSELEAFPEGMREREETGCCASAYAGLQNVGTGGPGHKPKAPPP